MSETDNKFITDSGNIYIRSENIRVFPCAYRGYYKSGAEPKVFDPEARATTEANFTNTFHALSSNKHSYSVAWVPDASGQVDGTDTSKPGTLKCVIGGYYFEIYNHTMEDFFYSIGDTKSPYYLCINTTQINLGTGADDSERKTEVLGSFADTTNYLDILINGTYVFTGLVLSAKPVGTANILPFITGSTFIEVGTASDIDDDHKQAQLGKYYFNEKMTKIESTNSLAPNGNPLYVKYDSYMIDPANLPVTSLLDVGGGKYSLRMVEDMTEQGSNTTTASGDYSVALGRQTVASGRESTALGANSTADGQGSLAAGIDTKASAKGAIALGNSAVAEATGALAAGNETQATNEGAVALGNETRSKGIGSLAAGVGTIAETNGSVALGNHTTTNAINQVVIGTYNVSDENQAFIIANGTDTTPTNKFTVGYEGNVKALGTLEVVGGSIKATNSSTNILELGTTTSGGSSGTIKVYGTGTEEVFKVTSSGETSIKGEVKISNTTESTNTTSGALQVSGGVGVSKNLNVGGTSTLSGNVSIISGTDSSGIADGALTIAGGIGVGKNLNVGANLKVNEDTTLKGTLTVANSKQTTLTGDTTINGITTIDNNTESIDHNSGALKIVGGVGIGKNLNVNGTTKITNTTAASSTNGALKVAGGIRADRGINTTTGDFSGEVNISNTTESTNTTSGALQVAGGVGVSKDLNVGKALTVGGDTLLNGIVTIALNTSGTTKLNIGDTTAGKSGSLYVYGTGSSSVFSVEENGSTSIAGTLTASSGINATGNITANGNITATGNITVIKTGSDVPALSIYSTNPDSNASITPMFKITNAGNTTIAGNVTITNSKKLSVSTISDLTSLSVNGAITASGTITASSTIQGSSFNATSDRRLKQNIEDFRFTGNILDLPIKQFEYINDESHTKYIGCIAQDLQQICPELIIESDDGFLAIQESKLIYALIQEVKELKEKVKLLERG